VADGAWFKSSFSGGSGGNCVEVAWPRPSFSGGNGGDRVEVSSLPARISVRDSNNAAGSRLRFGASTWDAFVRAVK
jgi:hypothetical protein